jgi:L-threonylcarbamoyladenylate synthase
MRMPSDDEIVRAVTALRAGAVIGLPTETVYGLAGDAANPDAVARIFAIKGRPPTHPVIVHLPSAAHVDRWARQVPDVARRLAERFWPGPLTLVLPRASTVLPVVTGGQDTVALRVPRHPVALAVLAGFDGGLAAPSANRYGRVSPTRAEHVREDLGDAVAMVLDGGPSDVGLESTIVACLDDAVTVLRPGQISVPDLEAVAGPLVAPTLVPRVPGSMASHYAPRTPVRLVPQDGLASFLESMGAVGRRVALLAPPHLAPAAPVATRIDAAPGAAEFARDLYAHLRTLDRASADVIVVARPPEGPLWQAIHDRLARAATPPDRG